VRIAIVALLLAACTERTEAPAPPAEIAIAPGAGWTAMRTGDAPMFRGSAGAFIFVGTARSADRLPGIGIGSETGPELTLLAGEFAPLVIPDRTDRAHQVRISAQGSTLAIDFGELTARVTEHDDWIRLAIDGRANLVLPSGRTTVKGFRGRRPIFAEKVSAWSEASIEVHAVDRIEVDTERRGTIVLVSDCAPRLIRPRARANTSSFLVRVGPARNAFDPSYSPANAEDRAPPCTGTATVSVRRP
jgi:hypothetical protein